MQIIVTKIEDDDRPPKLVHKMIDYNDTLDSSDCGADYCYWINSLVLLKNLIYKYELSELFLKKKTE